MASEPSGDDCCADGAADALEQALASTRAAISSRAMWKDMCELAGDLAFETGSDGRFTFVAPDRVLGYAAGALIGQSAAALMCVPDGLSAQQGPDPFAPAALCRAVDVWLRSADGTGRAFSISSRPLPGGGARGVGIDLAFPEQAARDLARAVRQRQSLDRIVRRMRDEVLAPRMIQAALAEIVACLEAEGAAIATTALADDADAGPGSEVAEPHDAAVAAYAVGTGWSAIGRVLAGAAASAARGADEPGTGASATELPCSLGRVALTHPVDVRCGSACSLTVWRQDPAPWSEEKREFVAAATALLRGPLESDHMQRELTRHARTDVLTGLLNRRVFAEEMGRRIDRLDRNREPATIMVLGLDNFTAVNTRYGQDCGDEALQNLAAILRDTVRPTDLVGRLGGDEFAVFLDGADRFTGAERAEALCRDGLRLRVGADTCRVDLSIGLASRPPRSDEELESFMRRAKTAKLHAKRSGGAAWRASRQGSDT